MKKQGFTLDEHRAWGAEFKRMHGALVTARVELGCKYPRKGKPAEAERALARAEAALSKARSALDDILGSEHPDDFLGVYFGGGGASASEP